METYEAPAPRREDWSRLLEWVGGTIVAPVRTLREVGAREAWLQALVVVAVIGLLEGAVRGAALLSDSAAGTSPFDDLLAGTSLEDVERTLTIFSLAQSVGGVVFRPVNWLILTGLYFVLAYLLGGRGRFTSLMAALGFAQVPSLLGAVVSTLTLLSTVGTGLGLLGSLAATAIGVPLTIWTTVLNVIAVRETLALSTGRAALAVLLPILVLIALALLLLCAVLAFAVLAVRQVEGA